MKKILVGIAVLVFLILLFAFIHAAIQPKPFQWVQSYYSYDRQPYGGYVIFDQLPNFFPNNKVKRLAKGDLGSYYNEVQMALYNNEEVGKIDSSLYLTTLDKSLQKEFNFFGLSDYFYLDEINVRALLLHLYQGNHAFIASYHLDGVFSELTGIKAEQAGTLSMDELKKKYSIILDDKEAVNLKPYDIFSKIINHPDSAQVIAKNSAGDVVGVHLPVGEGSLIFFTLPVIFSNYYILKENTFLNATLLMKLPNRDTYWANYFSGGYNVQQSRSLLSFIHSEPSLSWAFYTLIFTVLLYLSFQIKREQRPIPVIEAPENVSLKFSEVISSLYLMKKNHKEMVNKKMTFFLEQVRSKYHLDTHKIDEHFFQKLSMKTKVDLPKVKLLFIKYERLMNQKEVDKDDFLNFNKIIQNFKLNKNE